MKMKKLIPVLFAILSMQAHAIEPTDQALSECPDISEISKDPVRLNWVARTTEGLWKSYKISFATRLTTFSGAQWVGENIGQMFCVYKSEQALKIDGQPQTQATLPVILVLGTLTHVPSGYDWKHNQRGVRVCGSEDRSDCPFAVNQRPIVTDVYKEVESLKFDSPQN